MQTVLVEGTEVRKLTALEDRHWWYAERRRILRTMAREAFPADRAGRVAVDVGAAGGGNTRVLQRSGFLAVPLEYGPDGAGVARERGLPSVRGDACRLPLVGDCVDLLVAFDVLEHIDDDRTAMAEFHRVLRPGGLLFIAVPADMRLWSAHDEAVGHVRRYDRAGLSEVVADAGFEVLEVKSWNVLLRPLVSFRRRRATESDLGEIRPITNWVLGRVIALERFLPFLHGQGGVSLILRARRVTVHG
jgi:SAM-dependent methyltransferase